MPEEKFSPEKNSKIKTAAKAKIFDLVKEEQKRIRLEFRERIVGYIVSALGVVAGLAWNDAIRAVIEYVFPLNKSSIAAKFFYAFLVTVVIVVISIYLLRLFQKKEEENK